MAGWARHLLNFFAGFLARPCCSVPAMLAVLGITAGGVGAMFGEYRLWFILGASVFFGVSFYYNFLRNHSLSGMVVWFVSFSIAAFFLLGPAFQHGSDDYFQGDGTERVRFTVGGLACNACVERLRARLTRMDGIRGLSVEMTEKEAEVEYDPALTDLEKIKEGISEMGFSLLEGEVENGQ